MARRDPQLTLMLRAPRRWGGRRPGAGRKPGKRPIVQHVARGHFRMLPAHVTLRMRSDVESLRTDRVVREIQRTFAKGCTRPGFRLVHYSLQGNHAHLIVEAVDRAALGRGMMAIGARLARAVNRITGHRGRVLAERYHHRLLPTPKEVRNALRYVLLNAQGHAKRVGKVPSRAPRLDGASSARWFDGWKRGLALTRATKNIGPDAPRPVARARTWLLSVGWRRWGLLDPADVPG